MQNYAYLTQLKIILMNVVRILLIISSLSFSSLLVAESSAKSIEIASHYNQSTWNEWRKEYDQTVIGKGGWLSLAGLYWLHEGINTLGSDKSNEHILPAKAPSFIGSLKVIGDDVTLSTSMDSIFINSKSVEKAALSAQEKTLVTFGDFEFYIIKREIGFAVRLIDNAAKAREYFTGTKFIPFNQTLVTQAKLVRHKTPTVMKIPTVYGTTRKDNSAGWLEFEIDGIKQRLQAVDYGKDTLMYVMFTDTTSGDTTYGAGRYIEVEWPDENGNTMIDFNRAYNPACAFTNYATCPLTPRQNRLKVAINAGELDVIK
jgi:uncharacterized protein (DUF1684 family)